MSFGIFARPIKGRVAVKLDRVVAISDVSNEEEETKTIIKLDNGEDIALGTKFKTVLKQFGGSDGDDD